MKISIIPFPRDTLISVMCIFMNTSVCVPSFHCAWIYMCKYF